jgi:Arc/MetJ-type ribon-helix-helix transcriptional regulator
MAKSNNNADILRYALTHLEQERDAIQVKIDHINSQLGKKVSAPADSAEKGAAPRKKRTLSASARKRIAAAQKKRWAEHRKSQAKPEKAA